MTDILLIDAGNTRIKWCKAESQAGFRDVISQATEESLDPAGCAGLVGELHGYACRYGLSQVLLCHVLGDEWAGLFQSLMVQKGLRVVVPMQGQSERLATRYADPSQLGKDRWLGCLAVAAQTQSALNLVVSFGTATTIDAVVASKIVSQDLRRPWLHLGGVILPGVETMFDSLNRKTRQLPLAELSNADWPTRTLDAIGSGVVTAQFAPVKEALRKLQHLAPQEEVSLWVSGGYSKSVMDIAGMASYQVPSLVFAGLLAAASEKS